MRVRFKIIFVDGSHYLGYGVLKEVHIENLKELPMIKEVISPYITGELEEQD